MFLLRWFTIAYVWLENLIFGQLSSKPPPFQKMVEGVESDRCATVREVDKPFLFVDEIAYASPVTVSLINKLMVANQGKSEKLTSMANELGMEVEEIKCTPTIPYTLAPANYGSIELNALMRYRLRVRELKHWCHYKRQPIMN